MGRRLPTQLITLKYCSSNDLCVWLFVRITEAALVTLIHSHPRRDLTDLITVSELLTDLCLHYIIPDVPINATNIYNLPFQGCLASDLVYTMFDLDFNLNNSIRLTGMPGHLWHQAIITCLPYIKKKVRTCVRTIWIIYNKICLNKKSNQIFANGIDKSKFEV